MPPDPPRGACATGTPIYIRPPLNPLPSISPPLHTIPGYNPGGVYFLTKDIIEYLVRVSLGGYSSVFCTTF